jgi:hypothetical protein
MEENIVAPQGLMDEFECRLIDFPQTDCPVTHHFGPGVYIREVKIPAGSLVLGHKHRNPHVNILVSGRLKLMGENNCITELVAPAVISTLGGRKLAYAIDETIWQNVYATEERDIEKLEELLFEKTDVWKEHSERVFKLQREVHSDDRKDYLNVISDFGFDEISVRSISECKEDQIEFPKNTSQKVCIRPSAIEGMGVFASYPIDPFEIIGPVRIHGKRTPIGRYANHSKNPNSFFVKNDNGDIYAMSMKPIRGCVGGSNGDEITVDYYQVLTLNGCKLKGKEQ